MTRLSTDNINTITHRLPTIEQNYKDLTGKSMLELAHYAAGTEYLPLAVRRCTKVACVPITAGEGIISDFSKTVAKILREFADVDAFVTEGSDVAGFNEAILKYADLVYMADDNVCICRNLRTGATSDNGFATGRGFATLLYLGAKEAIDTEVLILGAGKVGAGAYHFLEARDVSLKWFDLKKKTPYALDPEHFEQSWKDRAWDYIIDATTCATFIDQDHINPGGIISAPGIPHGVTESGIEKAGIVFRDELETGIMTMFCEGMRDGYF